MKRNRRKLFLILAPVAAAIMLIGGLIVSQRDRMENTNVAEDESRLKDTCAVEQTLRFTRCGHAVTRRVSLPPSLVGAIFTQTQTHYQDWNIESFVSEKVVMSREIDLYCPVHIVLMTDETGYLGIFKNIYGDGMALEEKLKYTSADFAQDMREELFRGVGFDTREELDTYLNNHVNALR